MKNTAISSISETEQILGISHSSLFYLRNRGYCPVPCQSEPAGTLRFYTKGQIKLMRKIISDWRAGRKLTKRFKPELRER